VPLAAEYTDPRLVALYDTVCPFSVDRAYYLDLAAARHADRVVDVGCGTGLLTCEFARRGHRTTGLDPSPTMLAVARARADGDRVRWIEGDATRLPPGEADLVVMTGHVAQVITDDEAWRISLEGVHRALRPGGAFAFESRDPGRQAWGGGEDWASPRSFVDPVAGAFVVRQEVTAVVGDRVGFALHYELADGRRLVSHNELRFRTEATLTDQLAAAGFAVESVHGDWESRPVGPGTPELVFLAARP